MKTTRRILAMVLCLVLALSLATTAFAVDITFTGGADGATYSAWQLLNVTDGGDGKYAYTLNPKYTAVLQYVTGKTTEKEIIDYISVLDSTGINDFSQEVFEKLAKDSIAADYTTTNDEIIGAKPGYYLIAETALGTHPSGVSDTRSLNMINTLGNESLEITTKESYPTVEKEVQNVNDSTGENHWGEYADYDIGDTVPFRITGTLSGKYETYKSYRYQFVDTMTDGLTLNASSIKITIGHVDITSYFDINTTEHSFTAYADLKELDKACAEVEIIHNTEIDVTYTATVNENAKIGATGNKNTVRLEFENDPYYEDDGDPGTPPPPPPGKTPDDVNIVFTFEGIVNKVDKNGNPLAGAGFTLYKFIKDSNSWEKVGAEITGVTKFEFKGLDVGEYKLVETTVPAGHNRADDIEFKVVAVYDTTKDPVELTGLEVRNSMNDLISTTVSSLSDPIAIASDPTFSTVISSGTVSTNVVNLSGSELPSTGGMGTTLFYVFGGIMVLGAAVLLITKKRMAFAE